MEEKKKELRKYCNAPTILCDHKESCEECDSIHKRYALAKLEEEQIILGRA